MQFDCSGNFPLPQSIAAVHGLAVVGCPMLFSLMQHSLLMFSLMQHSLLHVSFECKVNKFVAWFADQHEKLSNLWPLFMRANPCL